MKDLERIEGLCFPFNLLKVNQRVRSVPQKVYGLKVRARVQQNPMLVHCTTISLNYISLLLTEIGYMDKLPCPAKGGKVRGSPKDNSLHCQVDTEGATRVLIISDEMTSGHDNDETYLRWNLANIRREISDEGRRKTSLEALSRTLSLSLSCIEPPQNSPLSPIREKTSNPSQRESEGSLLPDIDVIESEVQDIGDYGEGKLCMLVQCIPLSSSKYWPT